MNSPNEPVPGPSHQQAAEAVADARQLLKTLQSRLGQHQELDEAIIKLELALSALTLQTGGLL